VALIPAQIAGAATDTVTTCSGDATVPGSLPYEVANAASGDTITFSVSCPPSSPITLSSTVDIVTNLTIDGPGPSTLAVSGGGGVSVFAVNSGVTASISGLTIEHGSAQYDGGGINNSGTVIVTDNILSSNSAGYGGAIYNSGAAIVVNSTLSGNSANDNGGGVYSEGSGTASITDDIVSDNTATVFGGGILSKGTVNVAESTLSANTSSEGGGILEESGTLTVSSSTLSMNIGGGIFDGDSTLSVNTSTLSGNSDGEGIFSDTGSVVTVTNSTLSGNSAGGIFNEYNATAAVAATIVATSTPGKDCSGSITDAGYNLDNDGSCGFSATNHSQSDVNPYLGPLQNNGGPTETQAPAPGSPALNQMPLGTVADGVTLCPGTDQRGVVRPQGPECDIGAVELVFPKAIISPNSATATAGSDFSFTVTTSGSPVPSITEKGKLPKGLKFTNNGNGTATISGTPRKKGVKHLTITATFGSGTSRYVVSQAFTLTVDPK
jgi:predicted outer membrane repeat protein